ncbi:MAG: (2E,6E)-farnesyl diphosphate synthase [Gammaproteobacteria bacterium]|nr:MAG: (2E,6E)-farnesyl diphosphate synthase [Gammaproteobacteria bacterium]
MTVTNDTASFQALLAGYQRRTEAALERWLPSADTHPASLHEVMRYAVLGGGKRIRPVLVYAVGDALDVDRTQLDSPACAVELIHAYSLIHDDLPAMDDDELRRGRPTCHKAFGEAEAILAGDALQSLAFHILAANEFTAVSATARLEMVNTMAMASGSRGMAGGQAIDLASEGKSLSLLELENMHIHKTGALIRASIRLGALCAPDLESEQLKSLEHFGSCIGLAFQIQDDVLDETGDTSRLGKQSGADRARLKSTFPMVVGLAASRTRAHELLEEGLASLDEFGQTAEPLRQVARYIVSRDH